MSDGKHQAKVGLIFIKECVLTLLEHSHLLNIYLCFDAKCKSKVILYKILVIYCNNDAFYYVLKFIF